MTKPPRRRTLKVGTFVVASANAFPGAEPMTKLVVTAVHRDGTVDVAAVTHEWVRVDPEPLLELS